MSFSKIAALSGLAAFASKAAAHGIVTGIVADGVYYEGYQPSFQYLQTQPKVVGWSTPQDLNNGFVAPDNYTSSDIICHVAATNAQASAPVSAGGVVELQWTAWPSSHHGPVIDYLANCNGDCTTVDKTTLEWIKIDAQGLLDDTTVPGNWASDTLIANNNSWSVTIPKDIASGNYVLRHEIIALHSAENVDGAQNYPQCVNLQITGTGTAIPSGTLGTALYKVSDAGILVNIYQSLSTYEIPGPTLYSGAVSMSQTATGSGSATSSAAGVATTASGVVATSSAAGIAITSSSVSGFPAQITAPAAPYGNGTLPFASSSKTKKSACKSKSKSKTSTTSAAPLPTTNVGAVITSSSFLTSAASVTIATSLPATTTASSAQPSNTSGEATTLPEGTTLNTLLSWIAAFYDKYKGKSYDDTTVMRRHARDLSAAGL